MKVKVLSVLYCRYPVMVSPKLLSLLRDNESFQVSACSGSNDHKKRDPTPGGSFKVILARWASRAADSFFTRLSIELIVESSPILPGQTALLHSLLTLDTFLAYRSYGLKDTRLAYSADSARAQRSVPEATAAQALTSQMTVFYNFQITK